MKQDDSTDEISAERNVFDLIPVIPAGSSLEKSWKSPGKVLENDGQERAGA